MQIANSDKPLTLYRDIRMSGKVFAKRHKKAIQTILCESDCAKFGKQG